MAFTPTSLRKNIYKILDKVIETGEPVEIKRKGITLKIVKDKTQEEPLNRWELIEQLPDRDVWVGDLDDIFNMNWMEEWERKNS